MKIYILHDTMSGNGKRLSEHLSPLFGIKNEVLIGDVKQITPETVITYDPEIIIFVSAIRQFHNSDNMRKFFKALEKSLETQNKKIDAAVLILTHALSAKIIKVWGNIAMKTLHKSKYIQRLYPEYFAARVQNATGPFRPRELEKFDQMALKIEEWFNENKN